MSDILDRINRTTGVTGSGSRITTVEGVSTEDIFSSIEKKTGRRLRYSEMESLRNKGDFTTQIDRFVVDTERKLLEVVQNSLTDLTRDANTLKTKGGRVPVITGFLWSSAAAAINSRPVGHVRGDKKQTYTYNASEVEDVIARLQIGDTFYFGWTAEYARLMEARNGFLEGALMKWQSFVDRAVSRLR